LATFDGPIRRQVCGMTTMDNKLFVVYDQSDTIYVYTTQPSYTELAKVHVNGLQTSVDIAACSINSCLYVADSGSECVWKVKIDEVKVDKWLKGVRTAQSISVTSEGHIVVLILSVPQSRVDIYDTDAVKLSSLQLPCTIPRRVLQTVNKSFIVCDGSGPSDTEQRVCEVNNEGVVVKSYGESRGSHLGQLYMPWYIVLDSEERVFVADLDKGRVLLLDKQFNIRRVLLTWSRDCRPYRLFYDRETTQLIVGLDSGQVEIYSLL
jgi:hypothetical protein